MSYRRLCAVFLMFFLMGQVVSLNAQTPGSERDSYFSDVLQISQRPGTERALNEWLRPLAAGEDTVYALLFHPAGCPRCEASAQQFVAQFRLTFPAGRLVLWCAHGDPEAARRYMKRERLAGDTAVVDTADAWRRVFSLNNSGLNGIFFVKLSVATGRLLAGGELGYIDAGLFRELAAARTPLPFHSFGDEPGAPAIADSDDGPSGVKLHYERWPLLTDGQAIFSQLREPPVVRDGCLLLNDNLENAGFMFRLDEEARAFRLEHVLRVDSAQRDTFIDLPPRLYEQASSQFRYMVCGLNFATDDTVVFTYSLPRVFVERQVGDAVNLAFFNEPVILSWQVDPFRALPLTDISGALQDPDYMLQHFAVFPYAPGQVLMACQQLTYPLFDVEDSLRGHAGADPFVDAYYDRPHPYAVVVDRQTGRVVCQLGRLDEPMRRSRTGYGYVAPVADADGRQVVYGNAFDGRLYLVDPGRPDSVLCSYEVFGWGDREMPECDTAQFYTREYLLRYAGYFNRRIVQVQLAPQFVDCLVRESGNTRKHAGRDAYEYVRFDRATGEEVERLALRPEDGAETVLGYGLERGGRPFYVGKRAGRTFVKFIERGA